MFGMWMNKGLGLYSSSTSSDLFGFSVTFLYGINYGNWEEPSLATLFIGTRDSWTLWNWNGKINHFVVAAYMGDETLDILKEKSFQCGPQINERVMSSNNFKQLRMRRRPLKLVHNHFRMHWIHIFIGVCQEADGSRQIRNCGHVRQCLKSPINLHPKRINFFAIWSLNGWIDPCPCL